MAVVGVGHEWRGDDAAGLAVARALQPPAEGDGRAPWLAIEAGPAPENCTGPLRRFGPDLVLLVDAARMGEPPGTVRWLDWRAAGGFGASTHTLPLSMLARYLTAELGCVVALLGIQPADLGAGASLSPPVRQAVDRVARALAARSLQAG